MKIIAVDPGIEKTGYAVFEGNLYITSGLIKTSKTHSLPKRLAEIYNALKIIIEKNNPQLLVLEQLFFFKNKKTIINVSQAQGIILLLAHLKRIKVDFLTPLQIKQTITGYGRADKKSMQKMLSFQKNIPKIKEDDEIDAIACGLAFYYLNKERNFSQL